MDNYIFVAGELGVFNSLVDEKMKEYEPVGGPVVIPQIIKSRAIRMGQAMVKRRTVKIDKPVWEYAGEIADEDVYRLVNTARIRTR